MITTLTGNNSFLIKAELNKLRDEFISKYGDFGYEKVDGEEASPERLVEAATSLPFLAPKKLVVLRNPGSQKQFADNIENFISNVPDTTDLVIVEPKIDKRSVLYKVLKSQTDYKVLAQPDTQNLNTWIVQYVKQQAGRISLADANYLIDRVGQNQQLLANELDKLLLYNPEINKQEIDLLTEPTPHSTIFELLDSAFAHDEKKVMKLYKEQRALKVEPQQIMAMLAWQLHILLIVKTAGNKSADEIARQAKLSPFVVRKTMNIAKQINYGQVHDLINRALELDVKMKSKNIDSDEALKYFLLTI